MDTPLVIGLLVIFVVGFFAFQWWSTVNKRSVARAGPKSTGSNPLIEPAAPPAPIPVAPPKEEKYPEVAGQTEEDLRAKEPIQRRVPSSKQAPVTHEGHAPASFDEHLRHPEQSFHQPAPAAPTITVSDISSGRAAVESTPMGGHQQAFSPEMAQNGGAIVGSSVFAYDGMEPVGFSAF
jgi:hypothetical protein